MAPLFAGASGFACAAWKPGFDPSKLPAKEFLQDDSQRLNSVGSVSAKLLRGSGGNHDGGSRADIRKQPVALAVESVPGDPADFVFVIRFRDQIVGPALNHFGPKVFVSAARADDRLADPHQELLLVS